MLVLLSLLACAPEGVEEAPKEAPEAALSRSEEAPSDVVEVESGQKISCVPDFETSPQWDCQIWDPKDVSRSAKGRFATAEEPPETVWRWFASYDGVLIRLTDGSYIYPNGWIEYPKAGYKIQFANGRAITGDKVPLTE